MWRALERELVNILRGEGYFIDQPSETGDILVYVAEGNDAYLNITDLAKALVERGIGQGTPR